MSKKTKTHEEMYIVTHPEDPVWDQINERLLLRIFVQTRGARGFTEDEANIVHRWVQKIEFMNDFLKLAEEGNLSVDVRSDGELLFRAIRLPTLH